MKKYFKLLLFNLLMCVGICSVPQTSEAAVFDSTTYTITWNYNYDNHVEIEEETVSGIMAGMPISFPSISRPGYSIVSWYCVQNKTTYDATGLLSGPTYNELPSTTVTFTANWKANNYTVAFNANGGTTSTASKTVAYNSAYGTLPTPTRTGYTFAGWYTAIIGGTQITSSSKVTITEKQTLYAHWIANKYKVTFDANGGTCTIANKMVAYDSIYDTLPDATNTTRPLYKFVCWSSSPTEVIPVAETSVMKLTHNHTLYAVWSAKTANYIFDANGGTCSTTMKVFVSDEKLGELPVPTRKGYAFIGWYDKKYDGIQYTSNTINKSDSEVTLYAHWKAKDYIITLNANGGTCNTSAIGAVYNSYIEGLPIPKRAGYKFLGWYTSKTNGEKVNGATIYNYDKNITLYALWEKEYKNTTKTSISKLKNIKGKKIKIILKKKKDYNYQIQIATNKKFTKNVKKYNTSKTTYTIKKLKKGKTYYVRVRTCKKVNDEHYYSKWSSVKKIKVRK